MSTDVSQPVAPQLAIVTITFNNAGGLQRTLKSIAEQKGRLESLEHVVVDGGSSDHTDAIFSRYALPQSRLISEPDRGVYDAMNKGMRATSARYIQFLNAGDRLADDATVATVCGALRAESPTWLIGRAVNCHGSHGAASPIGNVPHVWWRHALGFQPHCHQATVFSRSLLECLGGHSEQFGFVGDFDVIFRAGLVSRPAIVDRILVLYEGGGLSAQRSSDIPRMLGRVRQERMQLTGGPRNLNSVFVVARYWRQRAHLWKTRWWRGITARGGKRCAKRSAPED